MNISRANMAVAVYQGVRALRKKKLCNQDVKAAVCLALMELIQESTMSIEHKLDCNMFIDLYYTDIVDGILVTDRGCCV